MWEWLWTELHWDNILYRWIVSLHFEMENNDETNVKLHTTYIGRSFIWWEDIYQTYFYDCMFSNENKLWTWNLKS